MLFGYKRPFLPEMMILWKISEIELLELLVPLPHLDTPPEGFSNGEKRHVPRAGTSIPSWPGLYTFTETGCCLCHF